MILVFHHFARSCVALIFLMAGVLKLTDVAQFAERLGDFGVVPDLLVGPSAWAISLLEVVLGLGLLLNLRGVLACLVILLLTFTSVLIYGIALGLDIDCGCFGPRYHVSLSTQVWIDCGLLVLCGAIYWSGKNDKVSADESETRE